jgi:DNA-binding transcriptional LysR family regulator
MDLRELRHFLAVAETRSFRRAAEALHLTQPAISKSIRSLETELGVQLFDRYREGVILTAVGEILLTHAKLISTELRHTLDAVSAAKSGTQGEVVVGAAFSMVETLLPQATANLLRHRPQVRVEVRSALVDDLIVMLRRGDVDLVFSGLPALAQREDISLAPLFTDRVEVVVRRGHPLITRGRPPRMKDLLSFPWVMFGPTILSKQYVETAFRGSGLTPPVTTAESNSSTYNKALVMSSDFVSYLPYQLIRKEHEAGWLVPLPFDKLTWHREVGVISRRRGSLSPAARALIAEIQNIVTGDQVLRTAEDLIETIGPKRRRPQRVSAPSLRPAG